MFFHTDEFGSLPNLKYVVLSKKIAFFKMENHNWKALFLHFLPLFQCVIFFLWGYLKSKCTSQFANELKEAIRIDSGQDQRNLTKSYGQLGRDTFDEHERRRTPPSGSYLQKLKYYFLTTFS